MRDVAEHERGSALGAKCLNERVTHRLIQPRNPGPEGRRLKRLDERPGINQRVA